MAGMCRRLARVRTGLFVALSPGHAIPTVHALR